MRSRRPAFAPWPKPIVKIRAPSSFASSAACRAGGSAELGQNDFHLTVSDALPGGLGLFFYGSTQVQLPLAEGTLCVGGGSQGIQRLQPPLQTDPTGSATRQVDFSAPPAGSQSGPPVAALTGPAECPRTARARRVFRGYSDGRARRRVSEPSD